MILGVVVFVVVKRFKGFKWTKQVQPIQLGHGGVEGNSNLRWKNTLGDVIVEK